MRRNLVLAFVAAGLCCFVRTAAGESLTGMFVELQPDCGALAPADETPDQPLCAQTVLAWKVTKGAHQGVQLDELAVVALIGGQATPEAGRPPRARATILVDAKADEQQRAALVDLARSLTKDTVLDVAAVEARTIDLRIGEGCALGSAILDAEVVKARVRRNDPAAAPGNGDLGTGRRYLASSFYTRRAATVTQFAVVDRGPDGSYNELVARDCPGAVVGSFFR